MVGLGIAQLLLQNSGIKMALLGGISPIMLPDNPQYPALTYQTISTVRTYTNDGPLGCVQTRVQLDCWGKTYASLLPIAQAVTNVLDSYTGPLPNGVDVRDIQQDGSHETYEPDAFLYRIQADWLVISEEA